MATPARWRKEVKILKGQDLIIRTRRGRHKFLGALGNFFLENFHSESHFWAFWGFKASEQKNASLRRKDNETHQNQ